MNIKPTEQQVRKWAEGAGKYADMKRKTWEAWNLLRDQKLAELAAKWGAAQAQQATPEGFVRVPLVMTQAMEEVTQQEDWQWADLLAAAEAVTEEQYNMVQAQQPPVEEPELPEAVAIRHSFDGYGYLYTDSGSGSLWKERAGCMPDAEPIYTSTQMQAYADAKVRAGAAGSPPAGWKLVPIEPTQEMLDAANMGDHEYTIRNFGSGSMLVMQGPYDHWAAMIEAAPAMQGGQQ